MHDAACIMFILRVICWRYPQAWELIQFLRAKIGDKMFERLLVLLATAVIAAGGGVLGLLILSGKLNPWTGRCVWWCHVVWFQ